MKIIAIGDIHGRTQWKKVIEQNTSDKLVFIGDYFDSKEDISGQDQLKNFKEIIAYKKDNSEKVILLPGNHDFHYLPSATERYSGYQPRYGSAFEDVLRDAINQGLMQICFVHQSFLFVHAGITRTWASNHPIDLRNIQQSVNELFRVNPNAFGFTPGEEYEPSGDETCQSPLWVRPQSLLKDRIEGYKQVAGHTPQDKLVLAEDIVLIDTLGGSGEYLQILDGEMSVLKIGS